MDMLIQRCCSVLASYKNLLSGQLLLTILVRKYCLLQAAKICDFDLITTFWLLMFFSFSNADLCYFCGGSQALDATSVFVLRTDK